MSVKESKEENENLLDKSCPEENSNAPEIGFVPYNKNSCFEDVTSDPSYSMEPFGDMDWMDGEEFFISMDGETGVDDRRNKEQNAETSFVAESFGDGEGDGVSGGDDLAGKKTEEEDNILRFDFGYENEDCYTESIAELYTYSEVREFEFNMRSFEDVVRELKLSNSWQQLTLTEKQRIILHLVDQLDIVHFTCRIKAKSTLLYIAQGCWKEVRSLKDQQDWAIYNISLLMKNGVFDSVLELLYFEVEENTELVGLGKSGMKEDTMADSFEVRLTLNLLYTLIETVRCTKILHSFLPYIKAEISEEGENKVLLATLLFGMLGDFARTNENSHLAVKKIVLLLWKVLLISLGGETELQEFQEQRRSNAGLPPVKTLVEDTRLPGKKETWSINKNSWKSETHYCQPRAFPELHESKIHKNMVTVPKLTLREKEQFFRKLTNKYFEDDHSPLPLEKEKNIELLLPACINSALQTVEKNVYVSLSDVQLRFEDKKTTFPLTFSEDFECINATETLYASIVPNLTTYTQGIVKILSLVTPSSSRKSISEAVPVKRLNWTPTDAMITDLDSARYKRIVFKALSAITLLLLKHTKVNHCLQFEHLCQELVKSDAISGFFSFFKVDSLVHDLKQNYNIDRYNFPHCVFGDLPEVTIDEIRTHSAIVDCQRSAILGYINAARILNKLSKGKPHRGIYMAKRCYFYLVDALKIKEPTFQRYIIKLLKSQVKYVKIKSKNDKDRKRFTMSKLVLLTEAYGSVRTNLTDEKWISFADEEYAGFSHVHYSSLEPTTQTLIHRYHWRKYQINVDQDLFPDDISDSSSASASADALTDCDCGEEELFKRNYERWLQLEVFNNPINWDQFLKEDSSYI